MQRQKLSLSILIQIIWHLADDKKLSKVSLKNISGNIFDSILYRMINSHNFPWFYSSYSLADKNLKPLDNKSILRSVAKTKCVVIPATIDKDMAFVGSTIGFDTAINTALTAIDKIRDTATTANVTHIVEVMGRNCGWLGILAGIGAGAEVTVIPEVKINITKLAQKIKHQLNTGKKGCIIILAEGGFSKGGASLANALKEKGNFDLRITTLGHMQRGGNPSAVDRVLATELGVNAVLALKDGFSDVIIAKPVATIEKVDFDKVVNAKVNVDMYLHDLIENTA
mgnify:CR=1 FL=1